MHTPESRGPEHASFQLPDLAGLESSVRSYIEHDTYIRKAVAEGQITEKELEIGRWITGFLDLNETPADDSESWSQKTYDAWIAKLPIACEAAAREFGITAQQAEELFERARNARMNAMDNTDNV